MQRELDERSVAADPVVQFRRWMNEALEAHLSMADAMVLATSTRDGKPSARVVLLKEADERGFAFYTNFGSRKGKDLSVNPRAALVLHWRELERQVRIEGRVERMSPAESDAYFQQRPRESQISAVVSRQSEIIGGREELETAAEQLRQQSAGRPIPCPPYWGGYRVVPESVEFWQNRPARLHDRILYRRRSGGAWEILRLAP